MSDRRVVVDTNRRSGQLFKVSEYSGTFHVYRVDVGIILNDETSIGSARSLEDALALIKVSADGEVRRIKIDS